MRQIDADFAKERIKKSDLTNREKIALILTLEDIPTLTPLPNDPLTLEELREMDGEPVWIEAKGIGRYDIYQGCANRCLEQFYKAALPSSSYGTDWLAYRRKPEFAAWARAGLRFLCGLHSRYEQYGTHGSRRSEGR